MDMEKCDRLKSGRGNAMLVSGSIYEACKFFELFDQTDLHGKCAIVTSYVPSTASIKGEESGEGQTEKLNQFAIYQKMLADWFDEAPEKAVNRVEEFEQTVKKKFIEEPGQMKLLIVVDKLLTGFDAPPATYLYIDKQMRDHGLFQAICRVNRLDGDDKEFGYIIDYKDLFKSLEGAVHDYTSGALDGYDKEDVAGLLEDRLSKARERLEDALEQARALCEPVEMPKDQAAYLRYFSSKESCNAEQLKANEPQRLSLYKLTAALIRAYANLANEMTAAGYSDADAAAIKAEVAHYAAVRDEVKLGAGEDVDFKQYEAGMRHLLDTYIQASASETVSNFENTGLIQLIVQMGAGAIDKLPPGIKNSPEAVAETIANNMRKVIIDEHATNPRYYDKMSALLDALLEERRKGALEYKDYLQKLLEQAAKLGKGDSDTIYPGWADNGARKALIDFGWPDPSFAIQIDTAVLTSKPHDWLGNPLKEKVVKRAIRRTLPSDFDRLDELFELVKARHEYQ